MTRTSNFQTFLSCFGRALLALTATAAAWAGTFGKVVPIGGYASDIVLDEPRGVLYIADFTANRIEVMNLSDLSINRSINVNPQPGSMALSPDGHFLVIGHYGNFDPTKAPPANALTVITLGSNSIQTFSLGFAPLGVAFGADGLALILTANEFLLFDPVSGAVQVLDTMQSVLGTVGLTAPPTLPVGAGSPGLPPNVITGSVAASGNGFFIYGLTNQIRFQYDVLHQVLSASGYTAPPAPLGPRLVSVNKTGTLAVSGWEVTDYGRNVLYDFPNPGGLLNVGTTVIDSNLNVIYAQVPPAGAGPSAPTALSANCLPDGRCVPAVSSSSVASSALEIVDADNLTLREQFLLPENLGGRSVLNKAGDTMYSISDSGVTVFPVGPKLSSAHRLVASQESVLFQGNGCAHGVVTQQITITDPGGGATDFQLSPQGPGIILTPGAGVTPATVSISYDPVAFQNQKGTITIPVQLTSVAGVNPPGPLQTFNVMINNTDPDQRGSVVRLPGALTDILPDPGFDRYYVLRQDKNEIFAYDAETNAQIATLRTGNVPTQMAITNDGGYLLVGHEASQYIAVFNLSTLQPDLPVIMPAGHYPRSVAVSGSAILAASREISLVPSNTTTTNCTFSSTSSSTTTSTPTGAASTGSASASSSCTTAAVTSYVAVIDVVDFTRRVATRPTPPTLGIFTNSLGSFDTVLTPTPNGSSIVGLGADGTLLMFDGNANTFTIDRVNPAAISGCSFKTPCPYAASSFGAVVIGNTVLNSSLIPAGTLGNGAALPTGFAFVDQLGYMTSSTSSTGPGVIQKVDLTLGTGYQATRIVESPTNTPAAKAAALAAVPAATASSTASGPTTTCTATTTSGNTITTGPCPPAVLPGVYTSVFSRTLAPLVNRLTLVSITQSGFTILPAAYDAAVPIPQITSIVNAADQTQPVAPGGLVNVMGSNLSLTNIATSQVPAPTAFGQSCLTVNGVALPLLLVSSTQINAQLPFTLDGNSQMTLRTPGGVSNNLNFTILPTAPSVFRTADQSPSVYRGNGALVSDANPVQAGDELVIYATGLGKTNPLVATGAGAPPNAVAMVQPRVVLGGTPLGVDFAGLSAGAVGVYEIHVSVPSGVAGGEGVPLTINQGGSSTTVNLQVASQDANQQDGSQQ